MTKPKKPDAPDVFAVAKRDKLWLWCEPTGRLFSPREHGEAHAHMISTRAWPGHWRALRTEAIMSLMETSVNHALNHLARVSEMLLVMRRFSASDK